MKKLIMLSVLGFMATGMYASNNIEKASKINLVEKKEVKQELNTQLATVFMIKITVNCEDGSSYTLSCDSCTSQQLANAAWALCN